MIFCHFIPLTAQKMKISKRWKKWLDKSSFYVYVSKIMIRWYTIPKIWCATDRRTKTKSDTKRWVGAPSKKLCDRSWDTRLNNFGPNWVQFLLLFEKRIFWENWLSLVFSTYCAPLCYYISNKKNKIGWSCDISCCSFGPNWT